jgi:hypothetical protein
VFFLLNDVVLSLELQSLTPPIVGRRFSALTLDHVRKLGREMFAEEPVLQHRVSERGRRLAMLIVSKEPAVNAALFVAPARGCRPEQVAVRLASLDLAILAALYQDQQYGRLTPAIANQQVWERITA